MLLHARRGTVVGPAGPTRFRKFKDEPGGPAPPYPGPPLRPLGEVEMRSPGENGASKTAAGAASHYSMCALITSAAPARGWLLCDCCQHFSSTSASLPRCWVCLL